MARPRVFISSTFYDLKHIRASLDVFVESLGFDPVLSEKGDIAYSPDAPLDESCYREATSADIFVLIIGGRYGTESSRSETRQTDGSAAKEFFDSYESITKKEYASAAKRGVPIYILIESGVHAEYRTYLRNRTSTQISYAHVDSVNVFKFIDEIFGSEKNNPCHAFERFSDMENWLREQWSGLFHDLLRRRSDQASLTELSMQVTELKDVTDTLKRYMESVLKKVEPDASSKLINAETARLAESEYPSMKRFRRLVWIQELSDNGIYPSAAVRTVRLASSFEDLLDGLFREANSPTLTPDRLRLICSGIGAEEAINLIRREYSLRPLLIPRRTWPKDRCLDDSQQVLPGLESTIAPSAPD